MPPSDNVAVDGNGDGTSTTVEYGRTVLTVAAEEPVVFLIVAPVLAGFAPVHWAFRKHFAQSSKKVKFFKVIFTKFENFVNFSGFFWYFLILFWIFLIFLECSRKLNKIYKTNENK